MYRLITTAVSSLGITQVEGNASTLRECASMQRRFADGCKLAGAEVLVDEADLIETTFLMLLFASNTFATFLNDMDL